MEEFYASRLDLDKPNPSRIYDCALGGYHNFAADRAALEQAMQVNPHTVAICRANRDFLRRVVEFLVAQGIDQFLDIGSGIPTVANVHEVAHRTNPEARVVYVDIDPVAITHSQEILKDIPQVTAILGDAHQPAYILSHPKVQALLDFNRPIALLMVTVLHYILHTPQAEDAVRTFCAPLVSGSFLVISHGTNEQAPPDVVARLEKLSDSTSNPLRNRSRAEITRFFDGLELLDPGLVFIPQWRPDPRLSPNATPYLFEREPERSQVLAGVARIP